MKRRITITLAVLSVIAVLGATTWKLLHRNQLLYEGKSLHALVESAVLDQRSPTQKDPNRALLWAIRSANPAEKARIQKECVDCVIRGLKTRDNILWRPYTAFKAIVPSAFSTWMPQWREPGKVRRAAAWWLCDRDLAWKLAPEPPEPAPPGLHESAAPILCKLVKNDPDPNVRQAALWGLGATGVFSEEALAIMMGALSHADTSDRRAALRWFGKNTLDPQKIVPVLVRGLEDNAMRSDYAEALRAYGPQARFVVEPLVALARTNDRPTASVAAWALAAIDPATAKKAGVSW